MSGSPQVRREEAPYYDRKAAHFQCLDGWTRFETGYIAGWASLVNTAEMPPIPSAPECHTATPHMCGLLAGIEAAKARSL